MGDDSVYDGPSPEVLLALRMVPRVGEALAQYVVDRSERRNRRAESFVTTASAESGLDPEELLSRIMKDPRLSELFERAVAHAVASASERKRSAFAKLLSTGVLAIDDAEVDLAELLLDAVSHLEVAELKLLDTMRNPPQDVRGRISIGTPMTMEMLFALYGGSPRAVETLVAKLEASGLIKNIASGKVGEQQWIVTPFGESVYSYIAAIDDESDDPARS